VQDRDIRETTVVVRCKIATSVRPRSSRGAIGSPGLTAVAIMVARAALTSHLSRSCRRCERPGLEPRGRLLGPACRTADETSLLSARVAADCRICRAPNAEKQKADGRRHRSAVGSGSVSRRPAKISDLGEFGAPWRRQDRDIRELTVVVRCKIATPVSLRSSPSAIRSPGLTAVAIMAARTALTSHMSRSCRAASEPSHVSRASRSWWRR